MELIEVFSLVVASVCIMYNSQSSQTSVIVSYYCALSSFLSRTDSISISIWNYKKVHKRQGAGFLGCVRLSASMISRIKDSGCE